MCILGVRLFILILPLSLFQAQLRRERQRNVLNVWVNNIEFTEDLRNFFVIYIYRIEMEDFTTILFRNFEIDIWKQFVWKKKRCYTFLTLLPSTRIFPLYDFTSTINNSFKKLVTFVRSKFNSTYSYNLSVTWMYAPRMYISLLFNDFITKWFSFLFFLSLSCVSGIEQNVPSVFQSRKKEKAYPLDAIISQMRSGRYFYSSILYG